MSDKTILQELRQPGYASDMTRRLADELEVVLRNKDEELEYLHSVRESRGKEIEDLEEEVEELTRQLKKMEQLQNTLAEEYIPINSYEAMLDRNAKIYRNVINRKDEEIEQLEEEVNQLKEKLKGAKGTISLLMTFNESHRRAFDKQAEELELLRQAAQAVVIRWNTPRWKDTEATAVYINLLQEASK